jgi:phosphoglycolate phosphatase
MPGANRLPVRLIVFDLDGTLIDSRRDLAFSLNLAIQAMGLRPLPLSTITAFVGDGVRKLIERALRESGGAAPDVAQKDEALRLFLAEYERHMLDSTKLYQGVRETLDALPWAKFAIASNKIESFSRAILEGLGIAKRFCAIIGGDSVSRHKPDPAPVLEAMRRCGCAAAETAMVGDSAVDILSGKNAGAITCGVAGGYRDVEELRAAECDFLIDTIADLPACFTAPE